MPGRDRRVIIRVSKLAGAAKVVCILQCRKDKGVPQGLAVSGEGACYCLVRLTCAAGVGSTPIATAAVSASACKELNQEDINVKQ